MMMCGGDGFADIIGRRLGQHKLPFSVDKSWAGSSAMFVASWVFSYGALMLFNTLGYFQPALEAGHTAIAVALIALAVTLVEALPFKDIDNLTLTLAAIVLGQMALK